MLDSEPIPSYTMGGTFHLLVPTPIVQMTYGRSDLTRRRQACQRF